MIQPQKNTDEHRLRKDAGQTEFNQCSSVLVFGRFDLICVNSRLTTFCLLLPALRLLVPNGLTADLVPDWVKQSGS
jgi:hypothetical protein